MWKRGKGRAVPSSRLRRPPGKPPVPFSKSAIRVMTAIHWRGSMLKRQSTSSTEVQHRARRVCLRSTYYTTSLPDDGFLSPIVSSLALPTALASVVPAPPETPTSSISMNLVSLAG